MRERTVGLVTYGSQENYSHGSSYGTMEALIDA